MKTFTTIVCMLLVQVAVLIGQNEQEFDPGVTWTAQVGKEFAGQFVIVEMYYKDFNGNNVYDETQGGTVDANGFLSFVVGHGTPGDEELKAEDFLRISTFCWGIGLDSAPVDGMQAVTAAPKANVAAHALNTEALGGWNFDDDVIRFEDFIRKVNAPITPENSLVALFNNGFGRSFRPLAVDDCFSQTESTMVFNDEVVGVLHFNGLGENSNKIVVGPLVPTHLENQVTLCFPSLDDALHALGVKVAAHRSPVNHNTAAMSLDNSESAMSAGLLSSAQTWGVYGTAQNGVVGITNGTNNGAGVTGFVGQAPAAGGFKYALYGTSNSQASSWAAALFGNSFHTGTLTMSSDARLKTEIRAQSKALDKVMQLRPSQYTYRQDTPYSLPSGIHHGFLAQDVEQIFPELVSDIPMPLSLDPQSIYKSETTEYKGINYIEMIAILTSAMQELNTSLNAKIDEQAKEIAELRTKLNARAN